MAHCVHMLPAEEDLMASTKTAIAHCPVSNTFLNSGFSPINKFLDKDISVGLGTGKPYQLEFSCGDNDYNDIKIS